MKLKIAVALLLAAWLMTTAFPTHAASGALMADLTRRQRQQLT